MSIAIFETPKVLIPAEVRKARCQSVVTDWKGGALSSSFEWSFVKDPQTLWFIASVPGQPDFDATPLRGEFVEGLWERDVAEFFIKDESGRYQEFNISPAGAWWTVLLTAYRTRSETTHEPRITAIDVKVEEMGWWALLGVACDDLSVALNERSTIHVSGISHKPTKHFISSHPPAGVDPDFHHPECFQPVRFLPL